MQNGGKMLCSGCENTVLQVIIFMMGRALIVTQCLNMDVLKDCQVLKTLTRSKFCDWFCLNGWLGHVLLKSKLSTL